APVVGPRTTITPANSGHQPTCPRWYSPLRRCRSRICHSPTISTTCAAATDGSETDRLLDLTDSWRSRGPLRQRTVLVRVQDSSSYLSQIHVELVFLGPIVRQCHRIGTIGRPAQPLLYLLLGLHDDPRRPHFESRRRQVGQQLRVRRQHQIVTTFRVESLTQP